jgi:hypothetical protein
VNAAMETFVFAFVSGKSSMFNNYRNKSTTRNEHFPAGLLALHFADFGYNHVA